MKEFRISNVGVDAGLIMICDEKYYNKWGTKLTYNKNKFGIICSQKIKVKSGTYKVKWSIDNTWNGAISGEGTVKTDSGMIAISDPCYCIKDWDKWLKDTNMGNDVSDDVVLIDEMGGDGEYDVDLELEDKEDQQMVTLITLNKKIKKQDLENFTRTLFKNRQKDRREKMAKTTEITKEKFKAYVEVQEAGVTNMFNLKNVIVFADEFCDVALTREDCLYIMEHYSELKEKFK